MEGGKAVEIEMLPKCMAIGHGSCYLRSVHDKGNGGGSFVELGDGGGANNPRCRFYLEASSKQHSDGSSLMHVRCCYNKKYWVPRQREQDGWIIGTSDEPEEDLSKPLCTLFKLLIPQHQEHSVRFLHSKLGKLCAAVPSSDTPTRRLYLPAAHGEESEEAEAGVVDAFTFLDLSQHKQLPKYLAFKGDNGRYLRVDSFPEDIPMAFGATLLYPAPRREYLQFAARDIRDPAVVHTCFTNDDGTVRIKSNEVDKFWRLTADDGGWIWPDSTDDTCNDSATLFEVIAWDTDEESGANSSIVLRNRGNNKICKRLPTGKSPKGFRRQDCLSASVDDDDDDDSSITQYARLQLEEPVVSRLIYDVQFHPDEARFHTIKEAVDVGTRKYNNTTSEQHTAKITSTETHTTTTTWSHSVSAKLGVKTTFKTGILKIVDGKIEVSGEATYSHGWGGTTTETRTEASEYSFAVPPHTKVSVRVVESKGVCEVPYSYKQKDVLLSGKEVVHEFHDGIFSNVSTKDIDYEPAEEKLECHVDVEEPPAEE